MLAPVAVDAVHYRFVLNSESDYVIEVEIELADGAVGRESCGTGTTTGQWDSPTSNTEESYALAQRLRNVLATRRFGSQQEFDQFLVDEIGEERPGRPKGSNVLAAFSAAFCSAAATSGGRPLWQHIAEEFGSTPSVPGVISNFINGGDHASPGVAITEAMVLARAGDLRSTIGILVSIFRELGRHLAVEYGPTALLRGMEGGYAPAVASSSEVLGWLQQACESGPTGFEAQIGVDMAANALYNAQTNMYTLDERALTSDQLTREYATWFKRFDRLRYLEDPFSDGDDRAWQAAALLDSERGIVADDLTSSWAQRLPETQATYSGVIAKVSQCGTLTNLADFCRASRDLGKSIIVSQRSRETDSSFLSHLAVGVGADFIKAGAVGRERIVKYNELLRISDSLAVRPDVHDH